jgi:mono/diheme cytochrome c family protein
MKKRDRSRQPLTHEVLLFVAAIVILAISGATASARAETIATLMPGTEQRTVSIDGSNARGSGGTVGSLSLTTPPGTAAGDYLLVWMERDGGVTPITVPAGWSPVGATVTDSGNNGTLYMYAKTATAEDAGGGGNYTWSWSGSVYANIGMYALNGAAGLDVYVGQTSNTNGSNTLGGGPLITTEANDLVIGIFHQNQAVTLALSGDLTTDFSVGGGGWAGGHKSQASPGSTGTSTASANNDAAWQTVLVAIESVNDPTPTPSVSPTAVSTPTFIPTPTGVATPPIVPTVDPTATATRTATATATVIATATPTPTVATPTSTPTASAGAITLPIEVIGAQGESQSVSFNLTSSEASSAASLWMQINGLSYADKARVQINAGNWVNLDNNTVQVAQPGASFEGIGGPWATLKMNLAATNWVNGSNTITFRMNQTDGISIGFRVLQFNVQDGSGNNLLPASQFEADNPNNWTAPLTDSADIATGQQLFQTAQLRRSSINNTQINARCGDCHTSDGRDLKYFNFSNYSIIQRAIFHGLSQLQGEQIASYIRSGLPNVPNPGRPWNPPYQPGPGLNSQPISSWAAGAGIGYVLDQDAETIPYLFPSGINAAAVSASGWVDAREIPVFLPLPDWNQWLPTIHPSDAFGASTWNSSQMNTRYQNMLSQLTNNQQAYITNTSPNVMGSGSSFNADLYNWMFGDRQQLFASISSSYNPTTSNYALQAAHWQLVKNFEMNQHFGLEGKLPQSEGYANATGGQDDRNWDSGIPFFTSAFRIGIPTNAKGPFNGDGLVDSYLTSAWYYLQLIVHSGQRMRGGNNPIDWGYFENHQGKEQEFTNQGEAMLMSMIFTRAMQESVVPYHVNGGQNNSSGQLLQPDYGWNPTWGANFQNLVFPEYYGYGYVGPWADLDPNTRGQVLNALVSSWLTQSQSWTASQYDAVLNDDGTPFGEPRLSCNTNKYGSTMFGDRMYSGMGMLESGGDWLSATISSSGLQPATIDAMANWASTLFPNCNWSQFEG